MFDATLGVLKIEVLEGDTFVTLVQHIGIGLPVGPDQQMPVHTGTVRVPLSKEAALLHGQQLIDAASRLPETKPASPLVVASSLDGVDKAADIDKKFRGGG